MSEEEASGFYEAIRGYSPRIVNLTEALTYAMRHVRKHDNPDCWFGPIANGVFYADYDRSFWFPDSLPQEVIGSLKVVLGEALNVECLEYWN